MLPLTRHGAREMLLGTAILAALGFALGYFFRWYVPLIILLPVWLWLLAFFRDPERATPAEQHIMVSPADGTVSDITDIDHSDLLQSPAVRVGIFLSVFNVHVNRAPCDGKVTQVIYKQGKFLNAMGHSAASEQNESNTLVISDPQDSRPIAIVKQIVGLIARRIICTSKEGDVVQRGQRIGMIKFGSRTELYIPRWLEPQISVKVGDKVSGARTVIARLRSPVPAVQADPAQVPATPQPAGA
jgi:phosphatidylserine decarboxylase